MNIALVLAGGIGRRFSGDSLDNQNKPKQLAMLKGKTVLAHAVDAFYQNDKIERIVVVSNADWLDETKKMLDEQFNNPFVEIIVGGESRQQSCYIGLKHIIKTGGSPEDIVLIHDGARPFVSQEIIEKNIEAAAIFGAVVTALPSNNSVFLSEDGKTLTSSLDRSQIYLSQTPQSFKMEHILKAHEKFKDYDTATDDASLMAGIGVEVKIVSGEKRNEKITTIDDIL